MERLARLAPDQRAAATAPPGPILCVAPAGSGKTTTLVARIAWRLDQGVPPGSITAITFNRRAAEELATRLDAAIAPLGIEAGAVRVKTFHALALQILRDARGGTPDLADRDAVLREVCPEASAAERRRLDTAFSRLKLELRVSAEAVASDPDAGPVARAFVAYEAALVASGTVDFDDLVPRALTLLETDAAVAARWREHCSELFVDEVQDVDRTQLDLALALAVPDHRIFLVGDDDQSIYGWRLADVRRVLALGDRLPGLRRVDLEVNHRCPAPVVERAVRLVGHNHERFFKRIRPSPRAAGTLTLAPDRSDEVDAIGRVMATWPPEADAAVLARTNRDLRPAVFAAVEGRRAFRPPPVALLVGSAHVDAILDRVDAETDPTLPLLVRVAAVRRSIATEATSDDDDDDPDTAPPRVAEALLGWAAGFDDLERLRGAIAAMRSQIEALCREEAPLTFATAHATKGLEFDHVVVVGMEVNRFPSARSVTEAVEPGRALEEERRLGYVAWTRARRSLTLLYDPAVPSPFLLEAFSPQELGLG